MNSYITSLDRRQLLISLAGCKMLSPAATAFAEISAKMSREQEVKTYRRFAETIHPRERGVP